MSSTDTITVIESRVSVEGETDLAQDQIRDNDPPASIRSVAEQPRNSSDTLSKTATNETVINLGQSISRIISRTGYQQESTTKSTSLRLSTDGGDITNDPQPSDISSIQLEIPPESIELGSLTEAVPQHGGTQGLPPELPNLFSEIIFISICSTGQLLFSFFYGDIVVNQVSFVKELGIAQSQAPWLLSAFLLANGLSVVISGALADVVGPKLMMVGAFAWLTAWNIGGFFSISPSINILFFLVRAAQGLAVGVLVSASMSVLGRIYKPGMRKNRVFSSMAAMAPFGFWLGCVQGGALNGRLSWIFGSSAIICALCCAGAYLCIPAIGPAKDSSSASPPSLKDFDYLGAVLAMASCACLLFGLTQGSPSKWSPYTYTLVVAGILLIAPFYFAERRARRPLIPNRLWLTPGFTPLVVSYFLGFGAYIGGWQFYAVQFWLTVQHASPLTCALYLLPNAVVGLLATYIVSKTLHLVSGHWILIASMLAYAMGPVFFLPQQQGTAYWALGMPGIALATFGPDLSFAAASIFITSSVARSYQGAAGSLLVTVQNLSAAVMTAVADSIGSRVGMDPQTGHLSLEALRAIWWFGFGSAMLGVVVCAVWVRMPKSEEKEHVS